MVIADVSLLGGFLPETLQILALLGLTLAALRIGRGWWLWRVLPVAVTSLVVVVIVNWALDLRGKFDEVIPLKFLVWASMPLVSVGLAVSGWRPNPRWQRAVSIAAVPLTLLYAANLINQFYGYMPTVGALFGSDVNHQVSADRLRLQTGASGAAGTGPPPSAGTTRGAASTGSNGAIGTTVPPPVATASTPTGQQPAGVSPAGASPAPSLHGTVSTVDIPGTISGFKARTAFVWVPPAFFRTPRLQLPVVVMLAGVPGQPDNMIRAASADRTANIYASAHAGIAPILIFPDANGSFTADTECVDSVRGNAETYLTKDVPAFVTHAFSALSGPDHWAVEGYSEGGTCAMDLALGHPDVYGSFVDIAGDQFPNVGTLGDAKAKAISSLFGGNAALFDAHDPLLLVQRPEDKKVAGWFEVGTNDHRKDAIATTLDTAFRAAGVSSEISRTPGGHDFPMATQAVADSFTWLAGRVGL
jgi:S-formylglutathione hydrolase FrmB